MKSFIILMVLAVGATAEQDRSSKTEYEWKSAWKRLNAYLTNITILVLEQADQHVNLTQIMEIGILPLNSSAIFRQWAIISRKPPKLNIDLSRLVIHEKWPIMNASYYKERQELKIILQSLTQLVEAPREKANQTKMLEECCSNKFEAIYTFLNSMLQTKDKLRKELSPEFDRRRFLYQSKILIGDFVGYQIFRRGFCSDNDSTIFTDDDGQSILASLAYADRQLINEWRESQVETDILSMNITSSKGIQQNYAIKKMLDKKYYWNTFRVHTYTDDFVEAAEILIGNNSRYILVPAADKNVLPFAIVIHWSANLLAEDKSENTSAVSDNRVTSTIQRNSTSNDFPMNKPELAEKSLSQAEPIGEIILAGIDKYKVQLENLKLDKFKNVLKLIGNVGKFLGPMAVGICSIISLFEESETQKVFDKVQKGFREMHDRFDILEEEIKHSTEEIKLTIGAAISYHTIESTYWQDIKVPLRILQQTENATNGLNGKEEAIQLTVQSHCIKDKKFVPSLLLNTLETYYFLERGTDSFSDSIVNWAQSKPPSWIRRLLFSLSMDAINIGWLVVNGCLQTKGSPYNSVTFRTIESARASRIVQEVLNILYETYDRYLHDWQPNVKGVVEMTVGQVLKRSPSKNETRKAIIDNVEAALINRFKGNNFNVFAFSVGVENWRKNGYRWVVNPDYAHLMEVGTWRLFINWNLAVETNQSTTFELTKSHILSEKCPENTTEILPLSSTILTTISSNKAKNTVRSALVLVDTDKVYRYPLKCKTGENSLCKAERRTAFINDDCCTRDNMKNNRFGFAYDRHQCTAHYRKQNTDAMERAIHFEAYVVNFGHGY